ncbi:MAG: hypothetical protein KAJ58_02845 [Candidatus Pacebacteria bacterium]|nr:hypothetical protein [Candidatus Paceibacterota bacterium]
MRTITVMVIMVVIIVTICWMGSPDKKESSQQQKKKWVYSWKQKGNGGKWFEGKASQVRFDKEGNVLSFHVLWPKTQTKAEYRRDSAKKTGTYTQKNEKGTWFLNKLARTNEFGGWEKSDKGVEGEIFLFTPKKQVSLGPDWKEIILQPGKWSKVFQMRNGSRWETIQGKVWVKVGNKKSILDTPTSKLLVGGSTIRFYPETDDVVLFFKY